MTIYVAKIKVLISCAVTFAKTGFLMTQLIWLILVSNLIFQKVFEPYWSQEDISHGLKRGHLIQVIIDACSLFCITRIIPT